MRLEKYFEDPEILHVGTEGRDAAASHRMKTESRRNCLSGNWKFHYFSSAAEVFAGIAGEGKGADITDVCRHINEGDGTVYRFHPVGRTMDMTATSISMCGFRSRSIRPYVPDENPCGLYETEFLERVTDTVAQLSLF